MLHLLPLRIILARASLFSRINFTKYDLAGIDFKDAVLRDWDDRCAFLVFLPSLDRLFLHAPPGRFFSEHVFFLIDVHGVRVIEALRFFDAIAKGTRLLALLLVLYNDLQDRVFLQ